MTDELYIRKCKCGRTFESERKLTRLCPYCREENRKASLKKNNPYVKKPVAEASKKSPELWNDTKDLDAFNRLCELYNKNHGTNYSYGQFELQRFLGKINIREVQ